jgi:hypothetical protein
MSKLHMTNSKNNNNDDDNNKESEETNKESEETNNSLSLGLTLAIWSIPLDAVVIHFSGWNHFLSSLATMKANTSNNDEFGSALKFWLLGAISHPIMDGAFWFSEVMHASPGPRLAGLVPVSFLLTSGLVAVALVVQPQFDRLRAVVTSTVLGLFLAHVGSGLDGSFPADYNIQIDDDYQGQVLKGCPVTPESVQSASVQRQDFEYQKYQGRWYWHKVHDWTQFHQMYDTTLDIQLTPDNDDEGGYINTLTLKGPSPSSSPLSWDKSPLLEGIRYSWQGTIDKKQANRGVSKESGFGVSFPNYIIDITTSSNNDNEEEYQELVQFQCIEVGGVRLYEGIDFMSRSPTMTDAQLDAMHQRVLQINPYGASTEQMHRIQQRQVETGSHIIEQNEWQKLWTTLGIEKYLDQSLKD